MTATIDSQITIASLGGLYRITVGSDSITGSIASLDTGFGTIVFAAACNTHSNQDAGDAAYCTVTHGADGLLDVYAWDDAGAAATVANTIYVMAIGY